MSTTGTAKYPREIVYVISCLEKNTGSLFFIGLDDYSKYMFSLGMYDGFSDEIYKTAIFNLLSDEKFRQAKGKFRLVVGFGEQVCRELEPEINKMMGEITFDPNLAINSSWEYVQQVFKNSPHFDIKPVSMAMTKVKTWSNFLSPEFVRHALPIPPNFTSQSKELLTDFIEQFPSGIEHIAMVDINATKRIINNLTQEEVAELLSELHEIPSHNGIIYLDVGNGFTSDFIYRLTHFDGGVNLVCYRMESERGPKFGAIAICSFKKRGAFVLHTPSGMSDSYRTAQLVSVVMRSGKVLSDVYVNFNKEATGINPEGLDLIPVAKHLYVGCSYQ